MMVFLGIDPGTATIGFGCIEVDSNQAAKALSYGIIQTDKRDTMPDRLRIIYEDMTQLLADLRPDAMAVEELFLLKNVNTAMPVAQARGVILLCGAQAGVPVFGYTPAQIKQTVTGTGRAEKIEVQEAVRDLLDLESIPRPDDAADGLAIALTHWQILVSRGEMPLLRTGA